MNITLTFPPLPAGYEQNPDAFLQWMSENAIFSADGDALSGQIGGDRPNEDVGIWFGDDAVEHFTDGEYQTITDVPVGGLVMFAGATLPANYLWANGQSLVREDYPLLFAAIGTVWGSESGTTFNVPDLRTRFPLGANGIEESGPGTYEPQGITARLPSRELGSYNGFMFPRNVASYEAAPTAAQGAKLFGNASMARATAKKYGSVEPPSAALHFIIRYR